MKTTFRKFEAEDYMRILNFLKETYRKTGSPDNWLIDRWNFVRYFSQNMCGTYESWPDTVGIWEDENGEIAAVVNSEGENSGEAFFQLSTYDVPDKFLIELFDYAEKNLSQNLDGCTKIRLRIQRDNAVIEKLARERGYKPLDWYETFTKMPLTGCLPVELPESFQIRNGSELTVEMQGIAHAKAFEYIGTDHAKITPDCYRALRNAPDYRAELDFAVVDMEGEVASFCTIWLDTTNGICILEPVGTIPKYRKMGLGREVIYHGFNAAAQMGAHTGFVCNDLPFYLRIGMKPAGTHVIWEKELKEL